MYVEHPYKFNDKFYAKVDGKFYEITREVAKAMLSAYRNEVYRSKKWQPEDPETMTRKTKWTELLDCVFSENTDGIGVQDLPDECQRSVEEKNNKEQIAMCFNAMQSEKWEALFD